jgi:hypothetical protein
VAVPTTNKNNKEEGEEEAEEREEGKEEKKTKRKEGKHERGTSLCHCRLFSSFPNLSSLARFGGLHHSKEA